MRSSGPSDLMHNIALQTSILEHERQLDSQKSVSKIQKKIGIIAFWILLIGLLAFLTWWISMH